MLDFNTYKSSLLSNGANLAQVRRNQSDRVTNITFTGDVGYKRCRILTADGWEWVDVKYSKHTTPSILKDEVDYYVQFRPKVHYKLGTYIIIPDDTSPEVNTPEDPFDQDYEDRTQWWLIVGRTDDNSDVNYSVLKCNWNFEWIYNGQILHCYGCVRSASSYTSGVWSGDKTTVLDNINSAWLPDVKLTYGKNYEALGLDDVQSIHHEMRFMISDNSIYPKTYEVSKVTELVPAGIIKLTMKQVPFNEKRDNIPLRICDYYDENGEPLVDKPEPIKPTPEEPDVPTSTIHWCVQNENGELEFVDDMSEFNKNLRLNKTSYFSAVFSDDYDGAYVWNVKMDDSEHDKYSDDEEDKFSDYIKITNFEDGSCALRPARVKELLGNKFILSVSDEFGGHYSEIEMEVIA